ncbi:hypothetical protein [Streptomyces parvulus]
MDFNLPSPRALAQRSFTGNPKIGMVEAYGLHPVSGPGLRHRRRR